jgi:hypothetical protein
MSGGSLARLVQRAQGQLPVAEPLLQPRFAPFGPSPGATGHLEMEAGWSDPVTDAAPVVRRDDLSPARQTQRVRSSSAIPVVPRDDLPLEHLTQRVRSSSAMPRTQHVPDAPFSTPAEPGLVAIRPATMPLPVPVAPAMPFAHQAADDTAPVGEQAVQYPCGPADAAKANTWSRAPERVASAPASPQRLPDAQTTASSIRLHPEAERLQPTSHRPAPIPGVPRASAPVANAAVSAPRPPHVHISIGRVEVHAVPARAAAARSAPVRRPQLSLADYLAQRK